MDAGRWPAHTLYIRGPICQFCYRMPYPPRSKGSSCRERLPRSLLLPLCPIVSSPRQKNQVWDPLDDSCRYCGSLPSGVWYSYCGCTTVPSGSVAPTKGWVFQRIPPFCLFSPCPSCDWYSIQDRPPHRTREWAQSRLTPGTHHSTW